MTNLPSIPRGASADLIQQASQFVLAVLFPKSKSAVYPLALNIAKAASLYQEVELEGRTFHVAFFAADIDAMKQALALLTFACRITHTKIYGRGQLITNPFRAVSVIECYMNSLKPDDHRAHCHVVKWYRVAVSRACVPALAPAVMLDGTPYEAGNFVIPCEYITRFADFKLGALPEVPFVDQIKAAGAKCSCDWCPNFRPGEFKKL